MKIISHKIVNKIQRKFNKLHHFGSGVIEYNLKSRIRTLAPKEMIINLTYWCNSRCIMCNIWKMKPKNEMSYEKWREVMTDKIFTTITSLTISGGEAALHPQFVELTQLFIDNMPKLSSINVISNGFATELILDRVEKIAKICKKAKIHLSVSISLDGIDSTHDDVRRIPQGFEKSVQTLKKLKKLSKHYDMSLGIGTLLLNQNIHQFNDIINWSKENQINLNFQLIGFHKTFVNNLETQKDLGYKKEYLPTLYSILEKFAAPKSLFDFRSYYWKDMLNYYKYNHPRTTPCPFLHDQFVLDSFGDVYYCLSEPKIGNVNKTNKTVSSLYYDKKNLQRRQRMATTVCRGCNSGCNVNYATAKDLKHYLWYLVTGSTWPGKRHTLHHQ